MRLSPLWRCASSARGAPPVSPSLPASPASSWPKAFEAKCWILPAPGAPPATGGLPTPGTATSGTSRFPMAPSTASTANPPAGSWKVVMTEVGQASWPVHLSHKDRLGGDRPGGLSYVELHARSAFSFLEGACVPEDLAGACAHLDMPAMALVDRNGVYGSPRFHMAAKKAGVRAHIGSEITCANGRTYPLLAASREGYRNLCRLVTRMKLRAPKGEGAITLDELAEFSRGLVC